MHASRPRTKNRTSSCSYLSCEKGWCWLFLYSDPDIRRLPLMRTLLKKDGAGCSSTAAALESDTAIVGRSSSETGSKDGRGVSLGSGVIGIGGALGTSDDELASSVEVKEYSVGSVMRTSDDELASSVEVEVYSVGVALRTSNVGEVSSACLIPIVRNTTAPELGDASGPCTRMTSPSWTPAGTGTVNGRPLGIVIVGLAPASASIWVIYNAARKSPLCDCCGSTIRSTGEGAGKTCTACSNAAAKAEIEWKRSSGRFARARKITESIAVVKSVLSVLGGTG